MVIMAVDDEEKALDEVVGSIQTAAPGSQIAAFRNVDEALQFFYAQPCDVVLLAIQMQHANGIAIAKQMKRIHPQVNIIFATNSKAYMEEAFALHASGYLLKPITPDKIRLELDNLRYPAAAALKKRVRFCTFGNFEVYIDDKPVKFKYDKTKELLAYLVGRHGAYANNAEIMAVLWEEKRRSSYLGNLKKDLLDTLRAKDCLDIVETGWNKLRVVPQNADCDYFDWHKGKRQAGCLYHGEYMAQYSWAELTNGMMYETSTKQHIK